MVALLLSTGCASLGAKQNTLARSPSAERGLPPDARRELPAQMPEFDPENKERRFGIAEASARRDEQRQAQIDRSQRLDVVDGPSPSSLPAAARPEAPPPKGQTATPTSEAGLRCSCHGAMAGEAGAGVHDHDHAATAAASTNR